MLRRVSDEVKKSGIRRIVLVACVGVILGFGFAIARGAWLLSLTYTPIQSGFSCAAEVDRALVQFMWLQLACALVGGMIALVILFFWRRFFRRRAEARQGSTPS